MLQKSIWKKNIKWSAQRDGVQQVESVSSLTHGYLIINGKESAKNSQADETTRPTLFKYKMSYKK